jgi:hypothetical protein
MRGRASEIEPEVGTYGDRGIETTICGNKGRGREREREREKVKFVGKMKSLAYGFTSLSVSALVGTPDIPILS